MNQIHAPSWRLAGFALSAAGAMLFAIKGVLIKLIYRYGIDTTSLLAMRMLLAVPVFALVGMQRWQRLESAAADGGLRLGRAEKSVQVGGSSLSRPVGRCVIVQRTTKVEVSSVRHRQYRAAAGLRASTRGRPASGSEKNTRRGT